MIRRVAVIFFGLLVLTGCFGPKQVSWDWSKTQRQVLTVWGERHIVALDLGFGMGGQFYLEAPALTPVADSRELLWLEFSGEVEFDMGNGQVVYEAVPIQMQVRTRLRREDNAYLMLEPEVKTLQIEFPIELMNSLLADSLAGQLSEVLVDQPLLQLDSEVLALQNQGALKLEVASEGLVFSAESSVLK